MIKDSCSCQRIVQVRVYHIFKEWRSVFFPSKYICMHGNSYFKAFMYTCICIIYKCLVNETVSWGFWLCFFIKQLLLVPLHTSRKDFKNFQIFQEFLVFVIYFQVYTTMESWFSRESSSIGLQKNLWMQNTPGSQHSPVMVTLGSLYSLVNLSPEDFL